MARRKLEKMPEFLSQPPLTADELRHKEEIRQTLIDLTERTRLRNLNNAVRVAQAVAAGRFPELEDHFGELGRRFADLLDRPAEAATRRAALKTIEGGKE
jgi:hypothetical protein